MSTPPVVAHVARVRRFNRFYTRQIGALDRGFLESEFSLTEVRVLYELRKRGRVTASVLGEALALDADT
jgi:DNA-binding MarR family transcriptional regulator